MNTNSTLGLGPNVTQLYVGARATARRADPRLFPFSPRAGSGTFKEVRIAPVEGARKRNQIQSVRHQITRELILVYNCSKKKSNHLSLETLKCLCTRLPQTFTMPAKTPDSHRVEDKSKSHGKKRKEREDVEGEDVEDDDDEDSSDDADNDDAAAAAGRRTEDSVRNGDDKEKKKRTMGLKERT